jgi:hypothetical protein
MLVGIIQPAKHPTESFPAGIQFTELEPGETIESGATSAIRLSDGADVTADILSGTPLIDADTLVQRLQGGDVGERYRIQMSITTSGSNSYQHWFELPMIPAAL